MINPANFKNADADWNPINSQGYLHSITEHQNNKATYEYEFEDKYDFEYQNHKSLFDCDKESGAFNNLGFNNYNSDWLFSDFKSDHTDYLNRIEVSDNINYKPISPLPIDWSNEEEKDKEVSAEEFELKPNHVHDLQLVHKLTGFSNNKVRKRLGVHSKAMIRMLRRYFKNLFKQENKTIVRKRFANIGADDMLDAVKALCNKYLSDQNLWRVDSETLNSNQSTTSNSQESLNDLALFLIRFTGLKYQPINHTKSEAEIRGEELVSWMYSFSWSKFENICRMSEFKTLFKHVIEDQSPIDNSKSVIEYIIQKEDNNISKNPSYFQKLFAELYLCCTASS